MTFSFPTPLVYSSPNLSVNESCIPVQLSSDYLLSLKTIPMCPCDAGIKKYPPK